MQARRRQQVPALRPAVVQARREVPEPQHVADDERHGRGGPDEDAVAPPSAVGQPAHHRDAAAAATHTTRVVAEIEERRRAPDREQPAVTVRRGAPPALEEPQHEAGEQEVDTELLHARRVVDRDRARRDHERAEVRQRPPGTEVRGAARTPRRCPPAPPRTRGAEPTRWPSGCSRSQVRRTIV